MHEILRLVTEGVTNNPPPAPSETIKVALITAISVVLAAGITAISGTFTRRSRDESSQSEQKYVDGIVKRAEVAERRVARLEHQRDSLMARVDELESYCWRAGIDPTTGVPVVPTNPRGGGSDDVPSQAEG